MSLNERNTKTAAAAAAAAVASNTERDFFSLHVKLALHLEKRFHSLLVSQPPLSLLLYVSRWLFGDVEEDEGITTLTQFHLSLRMQEAAVTTVLPIISLAKLEGGKIQICKDIYLDGS